LHPTGKALFTAAVGNVVDRTSLFVIWIRIWCRGNHQTRIPLIVIPCLATTHLDPRLDLRQFADVPVATESLDQQGAGVELSAPDIDVILFVAKSSRL
jgi:hypothetical protein